MEAYKLETNAVGRCGNCRRFRNNLSYKVTDKVVCIDCFTMFKNQRLIDSIVVPEKEKEPKAKPIKTKPNKSPQQPRPIKPKVNGIKLQPQSKERMVYDFIVSSPKPVFAKDIINAGICSNNIVYTHLKIIRNKGLIKSSPGLGRFVRYIDTEREHLLGNFGRISIGQTKRWRDKVETFINKSNEILTVEILINSLGRDNKAIVRAVKYLSSKDKIKLIVDPKNIGHRLLFCSNQQKHLVQQLDDLESNSTKNRAKEELIKAGKEGLSMTELMRRLGVNPKSGGTLKYLKRLTKEWGCKSYPKGSAKIYYFEEEG